MTGRGVDLFWRVLAIALLMVMGMMAFRTETNARANEVGRYESASLALPGLLGIVDTKTGRVYMSTVENATEGTWISFDPTTGGVQRIRR